MNNQISALDATAGWSYLLLNKCEAFINYNQRFSEEAMHEMVLLVREANTFTDRLSQSIHAGEIRFLDVQDIQNRVTKSKGKLVLILENNGWRGNDEETLDVDDLFGYADRYMVGAGNYGFPNN